MKIADLLNVVSKLQLLQGVERDLRGRRRAGTFAISAAAIFQVIIAVSKDNYLTNLGHFFTNLFTCNWSALFNGEYGLDSYEVIGMLVLVVGLAIFLIFRTTQLLLHESEESFLYTFSVYPFESVYSVEHDAENKAPQPLLQRMKMFHHDLIQKLNDNIGRLSLLDIKDDVSDRGSHIHVLGHIAIRNHDKHGHKIYVMPRVRIGNTEQPEELSPRIETTFKNNNDSKLEGCYQEILQQVYSHVATAIYQQIRKDIKQKIKLFPTRYLRAVGLYYEAKDFEQSNTVDAYEHAIDLYHQSLNYFETRRSQWFSNWLARRIVLWRLVRRAKLVEAQTRVAYARCLIYRNIVSALSGRTRNLLFHVPEQIERAVLSLEKFYKLASPYRAMRQKHPFLIFGHNKNILNDDDTRPSLYLVYPKSARALRKEPVFEQHRHALFDALSIWSLAYSQYGAMIKATKTLKYARRVAPDLTQTSALYMMAEAETTLKLQSRLQLLRKASDNTPKFEILAYRLAESLDLQFRIRNELTLKQAKPVLKAYEDVQKLNPGNIGAYSAYAYILWLVKDNEAAETAYLKGLSVKTIRRQTFVGDLNYGLARIAAEAGNRFDECYERYRQALASDPGVGVNTSVRTQSLNQNQYFNGFVKSMLERYQAFNKIVGEHITDAINKDQKQTDRTLSAVRSWVYNDYGNACFQYYLRTGLRNNLERSIEQYREASQSFPENAVVYFNLSTALNWKEEPTQEQVELLSKAVKLEPGWGELLRLSLERVQAVTGKAIRSKLLEKKDKNRSISSNSDELNKLGDRDDLKNKFDELNEDKNKLQNRSLYTSQGTDDEQKSETMDGKGRERLAELDKSIAESDNKLRRYDQLENEKIRLKSDISNIDESIEDFRRIRRDHLLPRLHDLIYSSSMTPFFGCVKIDHFIEAVPTFLAYEMRNDRLDSDSAEILRILVRLFADSLDKDSDVKHLKLARKLCRHVLAKYYPEDFILAYALKELCEYLRDRSGEIESIRLVRSAIDTSLQLEPTNWSALLWAKEYFDLMLSDYPMDNQTKDAATSCIEKVNELMVLPTELHHAFHIMGIELGKTWIEPVGKETWKVSDKSDGSIYSLSLQQGINETKKLQFAFDERRFERELNNALIDLQDIYDIQRVAVLHDMLGHLYSHANHDEKAINQYKIAIEKDKDNWLYPFNLGMHHYRQSRYPEAAKNFHKAVQLENNNHLIYDWLAYTEEKCDDSESRKRAIDALEKAYELMPENESYLERLSELRQKTATADQVGENNLDKVPLLLPITVEVATDLIPLVEKENGGLTDELLKLLDDLRKEFTEKYGVQVPGIRFRGNETDLPDGIYIIMINETPLVSGNIYPHQFLVMGTGEETGETDGEYEDTTHPDTNIPMVWLNKIQVEALGIAKEERWRPIEYLIWHLCKSLRRNLGEFLGHQEVQILLDQQFPGWGKDIRVNSNSLTELTLILKDLLEEETPINEFKALCEAYLDNRLTVSNLTELSSRLRRLPEIRRQLHGTEPNAILYTLSKEIERIITAGIQQQPSATLLVLEPELTNEILSVIRERELVEPDNVEAIVVRNRDIRRATRKLVELEFPDLWVIAEDELAEGSSHAYITIEFEQ